MDSEIFTKIVTVVFYRRYCKMNNPSTSTTPDCVSEYLRTEDFIDKFKLFWPIPFPKAVVIKLYSHVFTIYMYYTITKITMHLISTCVNKLSTCTSINFNVVHMKQTYLSAYMYICLHLIHFLFISLVVVVAATAIFFVYII